jgi:hypothetical protein
LRSPKVRAKILVVGFEQAEEAQHRVADPSEAMDCLGDCDPFRSADHGLAIEWEPSAHALSVTAPSARAFDIHGATSIAAAGEVREGRGETSHAERRRRPPFLICGRMPNIAGPCCEGGVAVTIDYLLIGLVTLVVLSIGIFLIKLRAVSLRQRLLEAQIKDMHILTSRLLLRELNARGDPQVSIIEEPAHQEETMSDDQSAPQPPEPRGAMKRFIPLGGKPR